MHLGVTRRETEAVGVAGEVGQAERSGVGDQQAEDPSALGKLADPGVDLVADAE
jgi:hypothetical protein